MSIRGFLKFVKEDYGKVIFAPDRLDSPKPAEANTSDENAAWEAFQKHYIGGKDTELVRNLPKILAAKRRGEHREFLQVPSEYKYAYRLMADLPLTVLNGTFKIPINKRSGPRGVARGGVYTNDRNIVSSWTVDLAVLPKLIDDFGSLYRRNPDSYHVLVVAEIDKNRDAFIINPDKYHDVPKMAGQFSYQREIISVKPVKLLKTVFCDKDEFRGDDRTIVQWLMENA